MPLTSKQKAAMLNHLKDPLYVNGHERNMAASGFAAGLDYMQNELAQAVVILPAVDKLVELQQAYLTSRTDANQKNMKRQQQLIETMLKKCRVQGLYQVNPGNPKADQKQLF